MERIAASAHQRLRAQHRAQLECAVITKVAAGHAHRHAGDEAHLVAARALLPVVDRVQRQMAHQRPVAGREVKAAMPRRIRLPGRSRRLAAHRIGTERARHPLLHAGHGVRIMVHGLALGLLGRHLMAGMIGRFRLRRSRGRPTGLRPRVRRMIGLGQWGLWGRRRGRCVAAMLRERRGGRRKRDGGTGGNQN